MTNSFAFALQHSSRAVGAAPVSRLGRFGGLALAGCLALAACNPQPQPNQTAPAEEVIEAVVETPVAPPPPAYIWSPTNAAIVDESVRPVALTVSDTDMAFAIFRDFAVAAGDDIIATAKVSGTAGEKVRVLLQRHCDSANGSDANGNVITLTGGEDTVQVAHVFSAAYSCVRVTVLKPDAGTLNVSVSDIQLAKRN